MENLNEDSMLEIFKYLPIIDRLRAEAVSKTWQRLIQKSWSNFKHLTFREEETWSNCEKDLKIGVINDKVFKNLINRFGRYLISIELSSQHYGIQSQLTHDSIRHIVQSCPKLQVVKLGHLFDPVGDSSVAKQSNSDDCECQPKLSKIIQALQEWDIMSNLKIFELQTGHANLGHVSALISRMKNLKSLHIVFEMFKEDPDFRTSEFPFSNLNELIFENCCSLKEETIIEIIKSIKNLRTLVLVDLLSCNVLKHLLPSQYGAIKTLYVGLEDYERPNVNEDRIFQNFVNLERLNLSYNCSLISDELLEVLSHHCRQLIFLDISDSYNVTDKGLQHIVSLPKLQCLFINSILKVEGKTLNKMDNLKVLNCSACTKIKDEGLCAIIRESKLRVVNVKKCRKITNKFLHAVIEELKSRKKENNLILMIEGTRINLNKIEKIPSLLRFVEGPKQLLDKIYKAYGYFPENELLRF